MKHGATERRILDYMVKGGADDLEGIAYWWMLEQNIKTETAKVKEALDRLVTDGLVLEVHGPDSRTRYQICPGMRKEIADLLDETGERE